ncbi:MAG: dephospho-CoA kinase [candidate division Zixibacteria bacterium]|nr:dephospho-CoA kinase [candidate division Zixibacteria bacterium]
MPVVGLTGCPGAGKSVVAGIFRDLGAAIESGDDIGREVVETNESIRNELADTFGEDVLDEEGNLLRRKVARIAFSSNSNLQKLNRIVHPYLLLELKKRIDNHRENDPDKLLVVDAALIFEWGIADWFDKTITVYADYWLRLKRLQSSGLTEREAVDRTESQIEQDEKIKRADYTIENNRMLKDLEQAVKKLYKQIS